MPFSPPHACATPGCPALVPRGRARCEPCSKKAQAQDVELRGTARERGYDSAWKARRLAFLRAHPLCRLCEEKGLCEPARVVDHVVPHKGDRALFEDDLNLQGLCIPCHNRKTATTDRGAWRPS
jgi:5-methylcytosine-specific restriction protein A